MDLADLKAGIERFTDSLTAADQQDLLSRVRSLSSAYPFNEYEYMLMYLIDRDAITFEDYEHLRETYVAANPYLELFELAPRIFGEVWGQQHLIGLDPRFTKPDTALNGEYEGQYDLWIEGVRVEVKAARAIDTETRGSLVSKALAFGDDRPLWMNFQQLKPDTAAVFVFVGVWIDVIKYWVLSAEEVRRSPYLSHQHRGGIEYQIGITPRNLADFEKYSVPGSEVGDEVVRKG